MKTLPALIDEALAKNHQGRTEFCDAINISRSTLARWDASLPGPPTLRLIAQHLHIPYQDVLAAALTGAGYLDTDADAPSTGAISIVINDADPDADDLYISDGLPGHGPVAAFTTTTDADQYVANANTISAPQSPFLVVTLPIDSTPAPTPVAIHTTWWNSASDTITCRETLTAAVPERFRDVRTTPVTATTDPDTGLITELSLSSLDPNTGRLALGQFLTALREHGRLAAPPLPSDRPRPASPAQEVPRDFTQPSELSDSTATPPTLSRALGLARSRYFAPQHLAHTPQELIQQLPSAGGTASAEGHPGETLLSSPIFSDPGTLDLPLSTESLVVFQGPSSSGKLHAAILLARGIANGRRAARIIAGSGKGTPIAEQPYLTDMGSLEAALSEGLAAQERRLNGTESTGMPLVLVLGSMLFPEPADALSVALQTFVGQCAATASAVILTTSGGKPQQDRIAAALPDHVATFIQL